MSWLNAVGSLQLLMYLYCAKDGRILHPSRAKGRKACLIRNTPPICFPALFRSGSWEAARGVALNSAKIFPVVPKTYRCGYTCRCKGRKKDEHQSISHEAQTLRENSRPSRPVASPTSIVGSRVTLRQKSTAQQSSPQERHAERIAAEKEKTLSVLLKTKST